MGDNSTIEGIEGEIFSYTSYLGDALSFNVKNACAVQNITLNCNNITQYNATNKLPFGNPVTPNPDIAGIGVSLHLSTLRSSN
jgi:hypothetical protein